MSTTTPTGPTTPAAEQPRGSRGWVAATIVAASLALVGMLAAIFMAVGGPVTSHAATNSSTAVVAHHKHHHSIPDHHLTPANPAVPVTPVTPVVKPSDAIKLEQQQLGRLNYYEGPINGYDTQATINAITYLQRDAGLSQTGHMNSATQAALTKMLISGNNNMAG